MNALEQLLATHREAIVQTWFHHVLETYPPETAKLWKKGQDHFANPVGYGLKVGTERIYASLMAKDDAAALDAAMEALDTIVRVRAVQNFAPSGAVGFIFLLKKSLREALWGELNEQGLWAQFLALETRIDGFALACLDIYGQCKEKLYAIKVKEIQDQQYLLLKRAQLIVGVGEGEPAE